MRLLYVWVTAVLSCFLITAFWYIGGTVVVSIVNAALTDVSGQALSLTTLLEYVAAWWGPILDAVIIFWAIMNSETEEMFSAGYRY